uniref:Uncharacterized protein n=1 Tax=Arundo donax TaxID=35708 RepID=A0A0A9EVF0_ARUDO
MKQPSCGDPHNNVLQFVLCMKPEAE